MSNTEYKVILLKDIKPDPNQPRKYYDERSMLELSQSIKENGVIQPILIRPAQKGKGYMIVCGERRFKASKYCGKDSIPAIIQDLSDEQALELQIIENLQRKDVHPLEEAVAFKSLTETMSTEDIALKVGKSASYVAKRIKLNDLTDDAKEIYFGGHISHSDALLMSRLEHDVQSEIIKDEAPKNWRQVKNDWSINNIQYYCNNASVDISSAIFKSSDANLYPEAGACTKCQFNSANQPLLFDDQKKKICSKPSCFNIKTIRFKKRRMEELLTDPNRVFIVKDSYLTDNEKSDLEAAKDLGIQVLDKKLYDFIYEEETPMSFEEWFEEEKWQYEEEDQEDVFDMVQAKMDYESYSQQQQKEYEEYQEKIKDCVMAYVVAGSGEGKEVPIKFKSNSAKELITSGDSSSTVLSETLSEISKIEWREERNKELDAEKVWQKITELAVEDKGGLLKNVSEFNLSEVIYFRAAVENATSRKFRKHIYGLFEEDKKLFIGNLYSLCRLLILDKLCNNYGNHITSEHNKLAYQFIKSIYPKEVAAIELQQQEIAESRKERVTKRINALKKQLPSK